MSGVRPLDSRMLQASVGRGRGRCFQSDEPSEPILRRPGSSEMTAPHLNHPSSFTTYMYPLEVIFHGPVDYITVYWALRNCLVKENLSSPDVDKMIHFLFSKVIIDPSNVVNIAKYVYLFSKHPEIGVMLKRKFFTSMELMFNDRELIRKSKGITAYRNFIAFFSAVTHYTRNYKYAPFDDLINALYTLFRPLISSTEDEDLKLFAFCMVRYSKYLKMRSSEGVPVSKFAEENFVDVSMELRVKIMTSLLTGGMSETAANWLTLTFEASAIGYDAIPRTAKLRYSSVLGPEIDSLSVCHEFIQIPKNESQMFLLKDIAEFIGFV